MWTFHLFITLQLYICLSRSLSVGSAREQLANNDTLTRRTQLFSDCSSGERIAIQNLLHDTILPMIQSAEVATSPRGFNRDYNRRKFFEYWGTYRSFFGGDLRADIYHQFVTDVNELTATPQGRVGLYCHGERLEEWCGQHPTWLLYVDKLLNEIVLVCQLLSSRSSAIAVPC